jgi:hypothetical protein
VGSKKAAFDLAAKKFPITTAPNVHKKRILSCFAKLLHYGNNAAENCGNSCA